jgi:hypothetical protein
MVEVFGLEFPDQFLINPHDAFDITIHQGGDSRARHFSLAGFDLFCCQHLCLLC